MIQVIPAFAAALIAGALPVYSQQRMVADITCSRVGTTIQYDCLLKLKGALSGHPIQGAAIVVVADMPATSMPQNVKPIKADPTGTPGEYRFRIALEEYREWGLKIRLANPRQDLFVRYMMSKE